MQHSSLKFRVTSHTCIWNHQIIIASTFTFFMSVSFLKHTSLCPSWRPVSVSVLMQQTATQHLQFSLVKVDVSVHCIILLFLKIYVILFDLQGKLKDGNQLFCVYVCLILCAQSPLLPPNILERERETGQWMIALSESDLCHWNCRQYFLMYSICFLCTLDADIIMYLYIYLRPQQNIDQETTKDFFLNRVNWWVDIL